MAVDQQYITRPSLAAPAPPAEPIWRLSVEQCHEMINAGIQNQIEVYTEPIAQAEEAEEPDYQRRQDYFPDDEIPVVIEGREVGRLTARELLP